MQAHDAYDPCASCRRHVKRTDAVCPFCGAVHRATRPRTRGVARVSRARWLAFGSTLVGIGCNGMLATENEVGVSRDAATPRADASMTHGIGVLGDAGEEPASDLPPPEGGGLADAASEAPQFPSPDASCPRSGTFTCGPMSCDRATELCVVVGNGVYQCQPLTGLSCIESCGSCPTCECIPPSMTCNICFAQSCFEDNFGGITVTCSQSGCYGSPPVRLDRPPFLA